MLFENVVGHHGSQALRPNVTRERSGAKGPNKAAGL